MNKLGIATDILLAMWAVFGLFIMLLAVAFGASWADAVPTTENYQAWILAFGAWIIIAIRAFLVLIRPKPAGI